MRSVYRWEGQLQDDSEMRVIFKTTVERWEAASEAIRRLHPYECPQIVATPLPWIEGTYGAWLSTQVEKQ
ncbi:MAG: divalent cation tolerance protein CutA [Pirellulaceae bacterium]